MGRTTSADLSRLLFEARESVEMWADVVEARMGVPDSYTRGLVERLDAYRAERGWSPHGFGGENDGIPLVYRVEFWFWGEDTYSSDMTRLNEAFDALEAQGVIKHTVSLGYRAPYPDESEEQ